MNAHEDLVRKLADDVAEQLGAPIAALLVDPLRALVDQIARARISALLENLKEPDAKQRRAKPRREGARKRLPVRKKRRAATEPSVRSSPLVASRVVPRAADREPAPATTKGEPRKRAVMRCGKCDELGFRSDGCGKTHNVAGAKAASSAPIVKPTMTVEVKPPPPPRSDRFAAIEAAARRRGAE